MEPNNEIIIKKTLAVTSGEQNIVRKTNGSKRAFIKPTNNNSEYLIRQENREKTYDGYPVYFVNSLSTILKKKIYYKLKVGF